MNFTIEQLMRAYFYFALYSFGGWVVQGCWVGFKNTGLLILVFTVAPGSPSLDLAVCSLSMSSILFDESVYGFL